MNVLLTCAGRRTHAVEAFRAAVGSGRVIACDSSADAPAMEEADLAVVVPPISDAGYIDALLRICAEHRVGLLIPAMEPELPKLAEARARFAEVGTQLMVSTPEVIARCYDKLETARFLESCGLPVARCFHSLKTARKAVLRGDIEFPLVVKPRWGVSSIGVQIVEDDQDLDLAYRLTRRLIARSFLASVSSTDPERYILIQEFLAGEEYGLDVINDFAGRHVCTFIKRKLRMRSGQTDRAVSVADPQLAAVGRVLGEKLGHCGVMDCDVIVAKGEVHVLDLNPRIGGGYPFSHLAGADIPAALVAWAEGREPEPRCFAIQPNVTASRCDRFLTMTPQLPST